MSRLSPEQLQRAKGDCTPKQRDALELWHAGYGWKRIGRVLEIDPSTAKARVEAALRRLGLSLEVFAP